MIADNGYKWFGYFKGMGYNTHEEDFEIYKGYKNSIKKR